MSEFILCGRCRHPESDIGPHGICVGTVTPATGPRPCRCPAFVLGPSEPGVCRSCGCAIWWWRTRNGRPAPFDADGVSHFATCPAAARHRRRRAS